MIEISHLHRHYQIHRYKILGCFGAALLLQAIIWSAAIPRISAIHTETNQLRATIGSLNRLLANQGARTNVDRSAIPSRIFDRIDSSRLIRLVDESASASNCAVVSMTPAQLNVPRSPNSWRIAMSGSFSCTGKLVQHLEQSEMIVEVNEIEIVRNRSRSSLNTRIVLNFWDPQ